MWQLAWHSEGKEGESRERIIEVRCTLKKWYRSQATINNNIRRLSLAKIIAYNIVSDKTTYNLFKAFSNMYEKPSASNKVILIRQLVNTKMNKGASVADLSWLGTVKAASGSTESTKLKFDNIRDLILKEDICRKTSREYSNSLLSAKDKGNDKKVNAALWHMSEKGMKILASKGRILDLQKAVVGFCEPCVLGKQKKEDPAFMLPLSMTATRSGEYSIREFIEYCAESEIRMLKIVLETPQQNDEWQGKEVSLAHLRVFGSDSYVKVKYVAKDKPDAKSMKCTFIDYGSDEMGYRFWDSKSHTDQVVLEVSLENLANKSIVAKRVLSSKITQSSRKSSDTSEGFKNNGSFEDSRRSYEESEEEGSKIPLRRSTRESRALVRNEEISSLEKNQTWSLVRFPTRKKALHNKWVFRVKQEHDGNERYNARLVVKGFQQKQRVEYNEIFFQVVKMTTIRLVLSIIAAEDLHLEQLNVKTTFLHGDLDEDIYMTQPEDFSQLEKKKTSCSDMAEIKKLKRQLSQEFEMKDLGSAKQILGMSIIKDKTKSTIRLSQEKYIRKTTLCFSRKEIVLEGFSDLDYGGCLDSSKSTTGYVFTAGGITVSQMSRIQKCVAVSTAKSEYVAIAEADKELVMVEEFS
nr:hypothetical protein [Tanacetum cinerariifolium]